MKLSILSVILGLLPVAGSHAGLSPLREHVDLHWTYDSTEGWTCEAKTGVLGEDVFPELDNVYLPLDDRAAEEGGERNEQPDLAAFAFTGVPPGEPIWISPQVQTPGQTWPGFNNYQGSGTFGSYQETDPRLSAADQALVLPWIKISFLGLSYVGSGEPAFSMWQTDSFGAPRVWFSTAAGQASFLLVAGSHVHGNWGFGATGIYRIRLSASAYKGPGQTNPTGESEIFTVTFAVGPVAQWQALHFNAAELDDAAVGGLAADPDGDGMTNLQEHAFGLDPRSGSRVPLAAGLGLPKFSTETIGGQLYQVLDYPRRRALDLTRPLSYVAEFSGNLGTWESQPLEAETVAELDEVWEKVRVRRVAPPGPGFGRVRVEMK
jgi:surface-anchored protein